ncbi:hypothetical protein PAEPH01_1189 [Pancytospora epiphaga]|nr:hypothetical protein PAEPH01_1189 [Pancytospora epiphaga]
MSNYKNLNYFLQYRSMVETIMIPKGYYRIIRLESMYRNAVRRYCCNGCRNNPGKIFECLLENENISERFRAYLLGSLDQDTVSVIYILTDCYDPFLHPDYYQVIMNDIRPPVNTNRNDIEEEHRIL